MALLIFEMLNRYIARGDSAMLELIVTFLWLVWLVSCFFPYISKVDCNSNFPPSYYRAHSVFAFEKVSNKYYIMILMSFHTYFLVCMDFTDDEVEI